MPRRAVPLTPITLPTFSPPPPQASRTRPPRVIRVGIGARGELRNLEISLHAHDARRVVARQPDDSAPLRHAEHLADRNTVAFCAPSSAARRNRSGSTDRRRSAPAG